LSYNWRGKYPEGGFANNGNFTLQGRAHPSPRLDLSASYAFNDMFTVFFDWTNILGEPFTSDIVRRNYNGSGSVTSTEVFPMVVRFEETVLSAGIRFNFAGRKAEAPAPAYVPPPPPPPEPVVAPPPVEAPPPPPPPAPVERGERGN
jgi:hypothetical protein